jgi:hypothetical protein
MIIKSNGIYRFVEDNVSGDVAQNTQSKISTKMIDRKKKKKKKKTNKNKKEKCNV